MSVNTHNYEMRHTVLFLGVLLWSSTTFAQTHRGDETRWRFDLSGSGSVLMGSDQRQFLDLNHGVGAALKAGYRIAGPLVAELGIDARLFLSKETNGAIHSANTGVRLEIPVGAVVVGPYAHVGVGLTGGNVVARFDIGVEGMLYVERTVGVGLLLSYNQVLWPDKDQYTSDARYLDIGLILRWVPGRLADAKREQTKRVPPRRTISRPAPPDPLPKDPIEEEEMMELLDQALPGKTVEHRLIPAVVFEFDSDQMLPCGEVALYAAVDRIMLSDGVVDIEGHADQQGTDAHNQALSHRRALAVKAWLIKQGVPAERLRVKAYGEDVKLSKSAASKLNRRVTFNVRTMSGQSKESQDGGQSCTVGETP